MEIHQGFDSFVFIYTGLICQAQVAGFRLPSTCSLPAILISMIVCPADGLLLFICVSLRAAILIPIFVLVCLKYVSILRSPPLSSMQSFILDASRTFENDVRVGTAEQHQAWISEFRGRTEVWQSVSQQRSPREMRWLGLTSRRASFDM